jgi:hypothetical protein
MKIIYALLCVAGALLPYSQFIPWVQEHGLNVSLLFRELFSTRVGGFFGMDVLVSSIVVVAFMVAERKQKRIPHSWLAVVALLTVGVSLALPLFLLLREFRDEKKNA